MKKLIVLLAVLAGFAWWYLDYSRSMTEALVRESYSEEAEAILKFDAKLLCARLTDDFQAIQSINQGGDSVEKRQDKNAYCTDLTKSMNLMERMSNASGGLLVPDIDTEIKNIELTPDRKLAHVEIVSTMRVGDMTLARSRGTEHLIRRNGRILSRGGEFRTWAYQGE